MPSIQLQQHLPFTVLKLFNPSCGIFCNIFTVATTPTVYGIETSTTVTIIATDLISVATTPTVYGIETIVVLAVSSEYHLVATTPTVYGIETC